MKKAIVPILAAAVVGLGVCSLVMWKKVVALDDRARSAELALEMEKGNRATQQVRAKDLERANQVLSEKVQKFTDVTMNLRATEAKQSSNLTAMAQLVKSTGVKEPGAEGEDGLFGKGMGDMLGKMMKDPAMREMMRSQQKAVINQMYGGLFKELNLTPAEKEKLSAVLTDSQMRTIENAQGLFGKKEDPAAQDTQKNIEETKKQTDEELKALLGDERFAKFQDYQKNLGERMQLDQLKTSLEAANLPLQEQQSAQLLQIMKEEKAAVPPVIPSDGTQLGQNMKELMTQENMKKQLDWMEDYNRRVLERANGVLSADQLKELKESQERQLAMQKLGLKMAGEMFGKGK
jgi:hypothetical protein